MLNASAIGQQSVLFGDSLDIDSKAMRRIEGDEGLIIMVENTGGFGFNIALGARFLLKAG